MTTRYASALEQIRALLAGRTQADPLLEARDIWEELTCYPVPSLRTVRRLMETLRLEAEIVGRRGQIRTTGRRGQTGSEGPRRLYRMTNEEMTTAIAELERRLDARDRGSVEIGERYVTLLDVEAKRQNTPRDQLAAVIVARWLRDNTDLLRPTGSPTH